MGDVHYSEDAVAQAAFVRNDMREEGKENTHEIDLRLSSTDPCVAAIAVSAGGCSAAEATVGSTAGPKVSDAPTH